MPAKVAYLDHAATSWPKPPGVTEAMVAAIEEYGANPGRAGHRLALAAGKAVSEARARCAAFLGVADTTSIIFTPGATYGLNLILKGALRPGDHVLVSPMEHNSVTRVLTLLALQGVRVEALPAGPQGMVDLDAAEKAIRHRSVRAVVCAHASNVTGVVQPVGDLADMAHDAGAYMMVDGAQAGGHLDLDLDAIGADGYALSGHKGLLGPQGVGLLYLASGFTPRELVQGGTGGAAESPVQPEERPERYEAGTLNAPGIAGLAAGIRWLQQDGHAAQIRANERGLARRLREGLAEIPGLRVLGDAIHEHVPVVSVVPDGVTAHELAFELDKRYDVAVRAGLHCAPAAHRTLGTLGTGAVRFGLGWDSTDDDVSRAIEAAAAVMGARAGTK